MRCPHCGLSVPLRAAYLTLDVCPRCVARRRVTRPMAVSLCSDPVAPAASAAPLALGERST
ncbi:MAG: hypothetical protein ABSH51_05940 [Solirubrobacteraceae bacterium]|jgi:hypothetical protein